MIRQFLKSKIHRATVTEAKLEYEGSITIDEGLMEASGIVPWEQVQVYNITNGERFVTYAIKGKRGTGTVCVNGAAARLASPGDKIIIVTFALLTEEEAAGYEPSVVLVDEGNRVKRVERGTFH